MAQYYRRIHSDLEQLASHVKFFQHFTILEEGKLLIDMELKSSKGRQVLIQFDNQREAEEWLYEHFVLYESTKGSGVEH